MPTMRRTLHRAMLHRIGGHFGQAIEWRIVHPAISEVLTGLDRSREQLRDALDAVPEPLRRERPASDRGSVVHILDPLAIVEERLTANLAATLEGARHGGLGREEGEPSLLSPDLRVRFADRSERRQAPDPLQPHGGISHEAAWERAETARAAFRLLI